MENQLLHVDGIDVFYGDAQALWDVSFSVKEGSIVALVGANGAGKSTTLNTISCVNRLTKGHISFNGISLTSRRPEEVSNVGIAHVPEGRRLFQKLTVLENLELGAYPSRHALMPWKPWNTSTRSFRCSDSAANSLPAP